MKFAGARPAIPKWLWSLFIPLGLIFLYCMAGELSRWWMWSRSEDYSRQAPNAMFRWVVGRKRPAGVTNLRVSGHSYFIKHWVWMTFNASPPVLNELFGPTAGERDENPGTLLQQSYNVPGPYDSRDRRLVGWPSVANLENADTYQLHGFEPSMWPAGRRFGWVGYAIVDRKNGRVFIHAGDL